MMIIRQMFSVVLVIATLFFSTNAEVSFRSIFGRDDYALVGISDCRIVTETAIPDGFCPYHMSNHSSGASCKDAFPVLYLPADKTSRIPPRLFMLFEDNGNLVYNSIDINFPPIIQNSSKSISYTLFNDRTFAYLQSSSDIPKLSSIRGVLFDHLSSHLYIIYFNKDGALHKMSCNVYFINPKSKDFSQPEVTFLYRFDVDNMFDDVEWSSDAYSRKFYYHKRSWDSGIQYDKVYSLPYESLTYHLRVGAEGDVVKSFLMEPRPSRDFVQVTNGVVYSTTSGLPAANDPLYRYMSDITDVEKRARCLLNKTRKRDYLFLLTGWEYCKLQNGTSAVYADCVVEKAEAHVDTANGGSGFLWAITIAIIANALILLIILCVLCRRRENDKYEAGLYGNGKHSNPNALLSPEEIFQRRRNTSTLTEF